MRGISFFVPEQHKEQCSDLFFKNLNVFESKRGTFGKCVEENKMLTVPKCVSTHSSCLLVMCDKVWLCGVRDSVCVLCVCKCLTGYERTTLESIDVRSLLKDQQQGYIRILSMYA